MEDRLTPTHLVVTTQPPTNITAGSPFSLVVAAENGQGNINTSFNGVIAISDAYGYSLGGTSTVNAVNGVATFSGLTEDTATYGDYLLVSSSGLSTVDTDYFGVTAAPATQLSAAAPTGVVANNQFTLTINAVDPFGNTDSNYNGNVTVSPAANPNQWLRSVFPM